MLAGIPGDHAGNECEYPIGLFLWSILYFHLRFRKLPSAIDEKTYSPAYKYRYEFYLNPDVSRH
jgi:hypothetical protein